MPISQELFNFLTELHQNNNRDWFNAHKSQFKEFEKEAKEFFGDIASSLSKFDQISNYKVYRIYRDVRFSKDKTPYKTRFAGGFQRATAALRGGYYLNIQPGLSGVGGGFYAPNPADLKRIREEISMDDQALRTILEKKEFKRTFGKMRGDELKTAPKGFDKEHQAIDLLRKKQFIFFRPFSDEEVIAEDFQTKVIETYKELRPFFDYMSEVLTTDSNGESIL
jgi:uncharacterized protein (TIGR02453 family)